MDTKELLSKVEKLKFAMDKESDAATKGLYKKKIDSLEKQIAEAEEKVEKVEAKAAAEEKKDLSEAEEKINKLKFAMDKESDPSTKALYQKKISKLEESLKEVKEEIKEEKKEIAEQKKDIKQATKEVKSAQREVRKTAIKKVAAKQVERKQVVTRKAKRKTKIKSIISDLDALINKNKQLKAKYKGKGTGKPVSLERDAARSAKPFGYRFVGKHDYRVPTEAQVRKGLKRGTIDYEGRPNRSDVYPKAKAKLADGGMMADGGNTHMADGYNHSTNLANISRHLKDRTSVEVGFEKISLIKKRKEKNGYPVYVIAEGYAPITVDVYENREIALKKAKELANKEGYRFADWKKVGEFQLEEYKGKMADGGMVFKKGDKVLLKDGGGRRTATIVQDGYDSKNRVRVRPEGFPMDMSVPMDEKYSDDKRLYVLHKMADGGMMAKGGYVGETVATVGESVVTKGGSGNYWAIVMGNGKIFLKKSFKTKQEAVKFLKESDKMADGGMMKKGGKVGSSQQDKSRYAKPAGWRWKDEAVTKRVIERKQLSMQPSKKMREKYPDLVYFEDRLNKADKKPTRTSADSI